MEAARQQQEEEAAAARERGLVNESIVAIEMASGIRRPALKSS